MDGAARSSSIFGRIREDALSWKTYNLIAERLNAELLIAELLIAALLIAVL